MFALLSVQQEMADPSKNTLLSDCAVSALEETAAAIGNLLRINCALVGLLYFVLNEKRPEL